jgi:hypothetical protein
MSTPTGVLGSEVWLPPQMIMGSSAEHMAECLCSLYRDWSNFDPMVADSQTSIRAFTPSRAAAIVLNCVERMRRGE